MGSDVGGDDLGVEFVVVGQVLDRLGIQIDDRHAVLVAAARQLHCGVRRVLAVPARKQRTTSGKRMSEREGRAALEERDGDENGAVLGRGRDEEGADEIEGVLERHIAAKLEPL